MKIALVNSDNKVENIVVASGVEFCTSAYPELTAVELVDGMLCDVGMTYDGETFSPVTVSLDKLKEDALQEFDVKTKAFILNCYDIERQVSLSLIRTDARLDGLTNRLAYVQQAVDWVNTVLGFHFYVNDLIRNCTSAEELSAIDTDIGANAPTDPEIWIETAMGITD